MKKRYLQKKATNEEIFTEFMKRVVAEHGEHTCFFVDRHWRTKGYEIHAAGEPPMFKTKQLY